MVREVVALVFSVDDNTSHVFRLPNKIEIDCDDKFKESDIVIYTLAKCLLGEPEIIKGEARKIKSGE